jgi:hypothetical protein
VYAGAAHPLQVEVARRLTEHNLGMGRRWNAPIDVHVGARIRTEVADLLFQDEHGRPPADGRERAAFLAVGSRQRTTAVAGYDLAFTPVKSVSVLWAVSSPAIATEIQAAHNAAVAATLAYLESEVLFTRRGRQGVQQVKTRGLVTAQFTHRDARSGDPNLHSHVQRPTSPTEPLPNPTAVLEWWRVRFAWSPSPLRWQPRSASSPVFCVASDPQTCLAPGENN